MISSEIDIVSGIDFQLTNLWDFVIFANPVSDITSQSQGIGTNVFNALTSTVSTVNDIFMKFKVVSTSIPSPTLSIEKTKYGRKHYQSREYESDFSVNIMEETSFSTYSYFRNWMEQNYDFEKDQWQILPITKTGMLTYYSGIGIPTAIFIYENLMIQGISTIEVNRSESKPLTYTVNFSFEKMKYISPTQSLLQSINQAAKNLAATIR